MPERISRDAYGLQLADAAAARADCTRRQVGAVIVAPDGSVVATGYNGLAAGKPGCLSAGACPRGRMAYPSEPPCKVGDEVPDQAQPLQDECPAMDPEGGWFCTRVDSHDGWHIAGDRSHVLAVWPTDAVQPADVGYEATGCRAVHAEVNAIIRAGRDRCVGATLYVTDEPCFHCSVVIEGAGIARVVTPHTDDVAETTESVKAEESGVRVPATAPSPSDVAPAPTPSNTEEPASHSAVKRPLTAPGDEAWLIQNIRTSS